MRCVLPALFGACVLAASVVQAQTIPVINGDFETVAVPANLTSFPNYDPNIPPGWTLYNPGGIPITENSFTTSDSQIGAEIALPSGYAAAPSGSNLAFFYADPGAQGTGVFGLEQTLFMFRSERFFECAYLILPIKVLIKRVIKTVRCKMAILNSKYKILHLPLNYNQVMKKYFFFITINGLEPPV